MLKIIGVSLIGVAHKRRGEVLQDFFNVYIKGDLHIFDLLGNNEEIKGQFEGDDIAFVFVADGAGSVKYGGDGAKYAVNYAINFVMNKDLVDKDPQGVLREILKNVLEGIEHRAKELSAGIEDLATTFMALYVRSHECFSISVGDGYIIIDDNGELRLLNEPSKGEYFNETQFITSPEIMEAVKDEVMEVRRSKCDAFVITTDGLWPTIIDGKPYEKFYRPIVDYLRVNNTDKAVDELFNLLKSAQEKYPSIYDDDLTIVVGAYE